MLSLVTLKQRCLYLITRHPRFSIGFCIFSTITIVHAGNPCIQLVFHIPKFGVVQKVVFLGHSFLRFRGILIIVGSPSPLWSHFIVLYSSCTSTFFLGPAPLLQSKTHPTSQDTTLLHNFPHNIIMTQIHLTSIIPSNPHLHNTHSLCIP